MIPILLLPLGIALVAARKAWRRIAALLCLALAAQGCAQWRMSADQQRDCEDTPYHVWRDGFCRRVR